MIRLRKERIVARHRSINCVFVLFVYISFIHLTVVGAEHIAVNKIVKKSLLL